MRSVIHMADGKWRGPVRPRADPPRSGPGSEWPVTRSGPASARDGRELRGVSTLRPRRAARNGSRCHGPPPLAQRIASFWSSRTVRPGTPPHRERAPRLVAGCRRRCRRGRPAVWMPHGARRTGFRRSTPRSVSWATVASMSSVNSVSVMPGNCLPRLAQSASVWPSRRRSPSGFPVRAPPGRSGCAEQAGVGQQCEAEAVDVEVDGLVVVAPSRWRRPSASTVTVIAPNAVNG